MSEQYVVELEHDETGEDDRLTVFENSAEAARAKADELMVDYTPVDVTHGDEYYDRTPEEERTEEDMGYWERLDQMSPEERDRRRPGLKEDAEPMDADTDTDTNPDTDSNVNPYAQESREDFERRLEAARNMDRELERSGELTDEEVDAELADLGEMEAEIEREDAPDPDDILEANAELYRQKNADYGGSWRLAGETIAMWAEQLNADLDLSDPQQAVAIGLYFQRMHKLTRGFNLEFGQGDPENEPIAESHRDESTYAAMHASLAEEE